MKTLFAFFLPFLFAGTVATTTPVAAYVTQIKTTGCIANQILPDSKCTPGAVLTTDTKPICVVGYTKTVRNVPLSEAKKVFAEYGIPYSQHGNYEVDHLISLELGGSNDISNLWPESHTISDGSFIKDKVENYMHAQLCSGKMTIQQAQNVIAHNWVSAYNAMPRSSSTKTTPASTATTTSPKTIPVSTTTSTATTGPETKKSSTGICHERGSRYYDETLHFTPYDSLDACLGSGGRSPKQ